MKAFRPFLFVFLFTLVQQSYAQRGVKLAYIDMDEILENVEEYKTAATLLDKNVANWKKDIELKKMELKGREEQLQAEKVLLTQELIEDRKLELQLFRSEIIDLQTKYFGPTGDYIQQKNNLLKPIQDQVLSIVRQLHKKESMILSLIALRTWLCYIPQKICLLYTSPSPRDGLLSRMPSSA